MQASSSSKLAEVYTRVHAHTVLWHMPPFSFPKSPGDVCVNVCTDDIL